MSEPTMAHHNRLGQRLLIAIMTGYRLAISPYLSMRCRYLPTCSEYAIEALQHYGCARGCWKILCRLLRCHPLSKGGYDPLKPRSREVE